MLCFAHLRWSFVYQRPQHVMARIAQRRPIVYFEEPEFGAGPPSLRTRQEANVTIATPQLPAGISAEDAVCEQSRLLDSLLSLGERRDPILWYYTPMALAFSRHVRGVRVYDCMDELSAFHNAPPELPALERELLAVSAVVFTGGRSLYYAKRRLHSNVHCYPSAVDERHFAPAGRPEPEELRGIPHPRLGFYGVIDERFDAVFVAELARELQDWHLIFVGPTAKIDPAMLPFAQNIHYLGMRAYGELPALLEHWDAALLPFALNDATRFISPTKTLEYLAARTPVISTAIADVADAYGAGIVTIAASPAQAAAHARRILHSPPSQAWHREVGRILQRSSWDATVRDMERDLELVEALALEVAG